MLFQRLKEPARPQCRYRHRNLSHKDAYYRLHLSCIQFSSLRVLQLYRGQEHHESL
uniref:Uncharacterized protein n=1 Tax=Schistosoma japonicum TaxID=6182 RepID=Q5BWD7_SCHJA|nr:unknown [Schistosoma japonicum]